MDDDEREDGIDDRNSPAFWFRMIDASSKRRQDVNKLAAMFMRWDEGDLHDLVDPQAAMNGERWRSGMNNKHSTAVTAGMADLMFRCPRFVVRPPYVPYRPKLPMPGMPAAPTPPAAQLFTEELSRCEEEMLRQEFQAANYFEKARRALQDALNADMGILMVTHDAEMSVEREVVEAAEEECQQEIDEFLRGNLRACWAKKGQLHSVHIQKKGQLLAAAERGDVMLDTTAIRYLKNHLRMHAAMKGEDAPTETIRANSICIERVSPLNYFYDPGPDNRFDRTWVAWRYLERRDAVVANDAYEMGARMQLRKCLDRWDHQRRTFMPSIETTGTFDLPEDLVMIYEVFDLVMQKRLVFADSATECLLNQDRGPLATLQPSGPFHELVFKESSMEGQGVPPPVSYAGDFAGGVHIAMSNVAAAVQNQPRNIFDPRRLDPTQVANAWKAPVGTVSPVEWKGPQDGKMEDAWIDTPACEIHESSMLVKSQCEEGVMTQSGLGVAKMLSGEQSPTATGAALGADASGSISDDRGAKIDAWCAGHARHAIRLIRYLTPHAQWVDRCGVVAMTAVPQKFALIDAANDMGVDVKVGFSRRNNTNVDQEQLLKFVSQVGPLPAMQGPAGQRLVLDATREFAEAAGLTNLRWDEVYAEVDQMAMLRQQQMMMGAPPPEGDGPPEDRSQENSPVAQNDLEQGVLNGAGGAGRVGVDESVGQSVVRNREAAQKRVAARV